MFPVVLPYPLPLPAPAISCSSLHHTLPMVHHIVRALLTGLARAYLFCAGLAGGAFLHGCQVWQPCQLSNVANCTKSSVMIES